jgi:ABC-type dipeptide/oligopeptide/nickel transport system permease component
MLAMCHRHLHWFTHSCLRKYSHVTAPDVGMSFAYAISVPTLVASRVGTSLALAISVPMLLASCVGTGCAIARSMPTLGWPLSLTRGEGVDLC